MAGTWELITVQTYTRYVSLYSANISKTALILDYIHGEYPDIILDKKDDGFNKLLCRLLKDGWEPFSYASNDMNHTLCFRRVSR